MSVLSLGCLHDGPSTCQRLVDQGLSLSAARDKVRWFSAAAKSLGKDGHHAQTPAFAFFVPGRIEILGKHTDYAGGRSLLVAVEKGFCAVAVPRGDASICLCDLSDETRVRFPFTPDLAPTPGTWSNYPMTVARRLARNFAGGLRGAEIAFASDLPRAAGMSSSSALVVATFLSLSAVNDLASRPEYTRNIGDLETLAGYLGTVENGLSFGTLLGDRGVGTFGGSEDHTAMLCARPGQIVQYAYCPVRFERAVQLPPDHVLVVAVSGVLADKTGNAMERYNRMSRLASSAVEVWRAASGRDDPHLAAAIASSPNAVARIREALARNPAGGFPTRQLLNRFEQFLAESEEIIPAVRDSLAGPSLQRFGELVDRSQTLGAQWLGNQTPETIWLAQRARELGAAAASAFGAGFGGSVWALVPIAEAEGIQERWSVSYHAAFPELAARGSFFATRAGPAAFQLGTS